MAEKAFADAQSTFPIYGDGEAAGSDFEFPVKPIPNSYQILMALEKLEAAYQCAFEQRVSSWEFAIEISDFKDQGISRMSLRQMVSNGWVEHQREISLPKLSERLFQPEATFAFSERSCFIITPMGRRQICAFSNTAARIFDRSTDPQEQASPRPVWDNEQRELRMGDVVVKRFKWPATLQFAVLQNFEDLGWPSRISDPLPGAENICPKRRLHDAIKCLNQRMESDLIRFRGDGTGQGILVSFQGNRKAG